MSENFSYHSVDQFQRCDSSLPNKLSIVIIGFKSYVIGIAVNCATPA